MKQGTATRWLNAIWAADLPHQSKYLACYLRKFMNNMSASAWPSYKRIIDETGLSRMTVSRYMKILETEGWIIRQTALLKLACCTEGRAGAEPNLPG